MSRVVPAGVGAVAHVGTEAAAARAPLARAESKLLACVHCGFCLPACPTYTRLGVEADSPRGRLDLMRAVAEGRLDASDPAFATHIDRCLGCRACETACPSGVQYGFLLERAREAAAAAGRTSAVNRTMLGVFRRGWLHRPLLAAARALRGSGIPRLLVRLVPRRFARARLGLAMLTASARPRLRIPAETAAAPAAETGAGAAAAIQPPPPSGRRPRVALLRGCVQSGLYGRVGEASVVALRANGCEVVDAPGQACCGALHAHGGDLDGARALARANIEAFERAGPEWVAVDAAGCGAAMKEYGELLEDDPVFAARARDFAARVRDVHEILAALNPRPGAPLPIRVTYDAPCHLHHAQRVVEEPLRVLRAVPGLVHVPLERADECCGGAGTYGLLHPDLGARVLADKLAAIRATGAEAVLTPNPGCMMQIGAGLILAGDRTPVLHPMELLAESYRRAGLA